MEYTAEDFKYYLKEKLISERLELVDYLNVIITFFSENPTTFTEYDIKIFDIENKMAIIQEYSRLCENVQKDYDDCVYDYLVVEDYVYEEKLSLLKNLHYLVNAKINGYTDELKELVINLIDLEISGIVSKDDLYNRISNLDFEPFKNKGAGLVTKHPTSLNKDKLGEEYFICMKPNEYNIYLLKTLVEELIETYLV